MKHGNNLELARCPHCNIANPLLGQTWSTNTSDHAKSNRRAWAVYVCRSCGGIVLAVSPNDLSHEIVNMWPAPQVVADEVPDRAKEFLSQAISSLHAPAGAVMLAASSVDAMLKDKGYKDGTLNNRINLAAKEHLITDEMAAWAHEIRLDANDQRHADESVSLPHADDAEKLIEFARALAQFLYVLPARVARGRRA